jgi:enoyl-CoA hydratase/carnithine racemase
MSHPVPSPSDPTALLLRHDEGGIACLTLNRPQSRNALSLAMMTALRDKFFTLARDHAIRVVIIKAEGPVFCAGHDLREMTQWRQDYDRGQVAFTQAFDLCAQMMQAIMQLPQPVIAAVEGMATAAGCQLVASCDLAVAGETAGFCTPGVHIGLFCSTPMVALSRNVGRKQAMEMLLLGERIPAHQALDFGLVNRVVKAGQAYDEALKLARVIASKSQRAVRIGKKAFYEQAEMPIADAYRHAGIVMVENMLSFDAEEGIGAFMEKRDPHWQDR